MGCMETALEPDAASSAKPAAHIATSDTAKDVHMKDATKTSNPLKYDSATALLFRCLLCKRLAHYQHLPPPSGIASEPDIADIALHYTESWLCSDCSSFTFALDKILAWRPYPANSVEPKRRADEAPNYKTPLPREYLVKWVDRSYRRTQWVPHMWLVSTNYAKLKNFLVDGPKVELLEEPVDDKAMEEVSSAQYQVVVDSRNSSVKPGIGPKPTAQPQDAMPDAERRIPPAWKTVDRVLELFLWRPRRSKQQKKGPPKKGQGKSKARIESDDDSMNDPEEDDEAQVERAAAFDHGEQPSSLFTESLDEWEARTKQTFSIDNVAQVAWIFVKWDDLTYDEGWYYFLTMYAYLPFRFQATWDSPPRPNEPEHLAFHTALRRFIASRTVYIPQTGLKGTKFEHRAKDGYSKRRLINPSDLKLGQDPAFKLMDFQVSNHP
jgi:chromodomain-helicase-DNA-binding protein 4